MASNRVRGNVRFNETREKAGATVAANNGATARQLMAIFGWDTIKQAEQYTRKADQRHPAEAAMHLLDKR